MEEKRKNNYYPENQKKWVAKNRAKRNYISRKSTAKNFILKEATLEDLQQLENYLKQRKEELAKNK